MVAPTLGGEKKSEEKPTGLVTVVMTPEDAPPIKKDAVYPAGEEHAKAIAEYRRQSKRRCCFCCSALALFVIFGLVLCTTWAMKRRGMYGFRCGVGYDDNYYMMDDYFWPGSYDSYDSSNYGEGIPFGDDMLNAPAGGELPRTVVRELNENIEINIDIRTVRITKPQDDITGHLNIIHDFSARLSLYHLPDSNLCYMSPLDYDNVVSPDDMRLNLEDSSYLDQRFPMSTKLYGVIPDQVDEMDMSETFKELCGGVPTYRINEIDEDDVEEFRSTFRELIRSKFPEGFGMMMGNTDEGMGGRREHGPRRHDGPRKHDGPGGDHGGRSGHHGPRGRHHDSDESDSSEEREPRVRRGIRDMVSKYVENVRSFGGQNIQNMRIYQLQKFDAIPDEVRSQLGEYVDGLDK